MVTAAFLLCAGDRAAMTHAMPGRRKCDPGDFPPQFCLSGNSSCTPRKCPSCGDFHCQCSSPSVPCSQQPLPSTPSPPPSGPPSPVLVPPNTLESCWSAMWETCWIRGIIMPTAECMACASEHAASLKTKGCDNDGVSEICSSNKMVVLNLIWSV
jgi:hypothetical protein